MKKMRCIFSLFTILCLVFFPLSCKPKRSEKNLTDQFTKDDAHELSAFLLGPNTSNENFKKEDPVEIHLYPEDERIIVISQDYELRKVQDFDELDRSLLLAYRYEDLYVTQLASLIDLSQDEVEENIQADPNAALNLSALNVRPLAKNTEGDIKIINEILNKTTSPSMTKGFGRWLGDRQEALRIKKDSQSSQKYFEGAIAKKRQQVANAKYSDLNNINLELKTTIIRDGKAIELKPENSGIVGLGMLPNKSILQKFKNFLPPEGPHNKDFHIVSLLEDFEMEYMRDPKWTKGVEEKIQKKLEQKFRKENIFISKNDLKKKVDLEIGKYKEFFQGELGDLLAQKKEASTLDLGDGRFRAEIKVTDELKERFSIKSHTQFSTRDRTQMNAAVVEESISHIARLMRKGEHVFVHCKSGKGRSATVVVGARVALLIDQAKKNGISLTPKEIKKMLEDEMTAVKSVRKEIGISLIQKENLQRVLERRSVRPLDDKDYSQKIADMEGSLNQVKIKPEDLEKDVIFARNFEEDKLYALEEKLKTAKAFSYERQLKEVQNSLLLYKKGQLQDENLKKTFDKWKDWKINNPTGYKKLITEDLEKLKNTTSFVEDQIAAQERKISKLNSLLAQYKRRYNEN